MKTIIIITTALMLISCSKSGHRNEMKIARVIETGEKIEIKAPHYIKGDTIQAYYYVSDWRLNTVFSKFEGNSLFYDRAMIRVYKAVIL